MKQIFIITEFSFAGPIVSLNSSQVSKICKTLEEANEFVTAPANRGRPLVVLPAYEMLNSRQFHYLTINNKPMTKEDIAQVIHEVTRAYYEALNNQNMLLKPWAMATDVQKQTALQSVDYHLNNPDATPEQIHAAWLKDKADNGWGYGHIKDETRKQHPSIVPYTALPIEQRAKDYLVRALVHSLKGFLKVAPVWDKEEDFITTAPAATQPIPVPLTDIPVVQPPLISSQGGTEIPVMAEVAEKEIPPPTSSTLPPPTE